MLLKNLVLIFTVFIVVISAYIFIRNFNNTIIIIKSCFSTYTILTKKKKKKKKYK